MWDNHWEITSNNIGIKINEKKGIDFLSSISQVVTVRNVPYKHFIFSVSADVDGIYILADGKVGFSKDTKEQFQIKMHKTPGFVYSENWFQTTMAPNSLLCEFEVWKGNTHHTSTISLSSNGVKLLFIPKTYYRKLIKYIWTTRPRWNGKYLTPSTNNFSSP